MGRVIRKRIERPTSDEALWRTLFGQLDEPSGESRASYAGLGIGRSPDDLPQWPPPVGLLDPMLEQMLQPRSQWTAEQWQAWALLLEEGGAAMLQRLRSERDIRRAAEAKLARGRTRAAPRMPAGILSVLEQLAARPAGKRGRPKGSLAQELAQEALELKAEMQANAPPGVRITNMKAVERLRQQRGERQYRPQENRSILNAMSRQRRSHSKSQT